MKREWFASWFDTSYYHLLYRDRNDQEAHQFIDALLAFLSLPQGKKVLDIACGKGRHAIYLQSKGYDVVGLDLSKNSIEAAKNLSQHTASIEFLVHDIRNEFPVTHADLALNLFTSFGYFESDTEHQEVLINMAGALNNEGVLVLDFLNVDHVAKHLKQHEQKTIDDVSFSIHRTLDNNQIIKNIQVKDGEDTLVFKEIVRAFSANDLIQLIENAGLKVMNVFGNYNLTPLSINSERVIIIAKK